MTTGTLQERMMTISRYFTREKWKNETGIFQYPRGKRRTDAVVEALEIAFEPTEFELKKELNLRGDDVVGNVYIVSVPAEDTFDLLRDIYSLDEDEYLKTKNELVKLLEIEEIIKKPVRTLSLGERMRCELCASLLHKPKILFLDEPTIGLDAKSKVIVRNFIEKINKKNHVTVILTTHDMSDIEALAKRIILIGKGKILYDGAIDSLKKKYGCYKTVSIITRDRIENIEFNGIVKRKFCDGVYKFVIDTNIITISSFINYVSNSYNLEDLDVDNETIDDIILKLYEDYNV